MITEAAEIRGELELAVTIIVLSLKPHASMVYSRVTVAENMEIRAI